MWLGTTWLRRSAAASGDGRKCGEPNYIILDVAIRDIKLRGLTRFRDNASARMLALSSVDDAVAEGIIMSTSRPHDEARRGTTEEAFPLRELPLWRLAGSLAIAAGSLFTLANLGWSLGKPQIDR